MRRALWHNSSVMAAKDIYLRKKEPERLLYLAVDVGVYASFLSQPHVEPLLREENIRLIVFEPIKEEIIEWINWTDTET